MRMPNRKLIFILGIGCRVTGGTRISNHSSASSFQRLRLASSKTLHGIGS